MKKHYGEDWDKFKIRLNQNLIVNPTLPPSTPFGNPEDELLVETDPFTQNVFEELQILGVVMVIPPVSPG